MGPHAGFWAKKTMHRSAARSIASVGKLMHRDRMPMQLRDMYSRLAAESNEQQRAALQKQAWQFRNAG